ncbi:hypothetical protein GCM10010387_49980 [Streptomyces inusitatus]|uniref:Uncharacterized protein n=1 Tax=Streptomyces inusitatus TaxID=68221 RepID=A0A918QJX3_9ACTN|nr:hypothetical protein GCM10010387_49980 [Streptomyces inusitatus]
MSGSAADDVQGGDDEDVAAHVVDDESGGGGRLLSFSRPLFAEVEPCPSWFPASWAIPASQQSRPSARPAARWYENRVATLTPTGP